MDLDILNSQPKRFSGSVCHTCPTGLLTLDIVRERRSLKFQPGDFVLLSKVSSYTQPPDEMKQGPDRASS